MKTIMETETLHLAQQLIACPSITPEDAGCQTIIAERLSDLDFALMDLSHGSGA